MSSRLSLEIFHQSNTLNLDKFGSDLGFHDENLDFRRKIRANILLKKA
jgi:hypothetical protein